MFSAILTFSIELELEDTKQHQLSLNRIRKTSKMRHSIDNLKFHHIQPELGKTKSFLQSITTHKCIDIGSQLYRM